MLELSSTPSLPFYSYFVDRLLPIFFFFFLYRNRVHFPIGTQKLSAISGPRALLGETSRKNLGLSLSLGTKNPNYIITFFLTLLRFSFAIHFCHLLRFIL